jgi:hypothetical protein
MNVMILTMLVESKMYHDNTLPYIIKTHIVQTQKYIKIASNLETSTLVNGTKPIQSH